MNEISPILSRVQVSYGLEQENLRSLSWNYLRRVAGSLSPPDIIGLSRVVTAYDAHGKLVVTERREPHGYFLTHGHGPLDRWAQQRAEALAGRPGGDSAEIISDFASAEELRRRHEATGLRVAILGNPRHVEQVPLFFEAANMIDDGPSVYIDTSGTDNLAPDEARLVAVGGPGEEHWQAFDAIVVRGLAVHRETRGWGYVAPAAIRAGSLAMHEALNAYTGPRSRAS